MRKHSTLFTEIKAWIGIPHYAWVCKCGGELLIASQDTSLAVGRPSKVDDKVFCEEYKRVESWELRPGEFMKHLGISKAIYHEYRKRLNLKV
ncbi:MAG: hypothetical protein Q4F41_05530 [Eubacteriales bacterium]|nr:hypothetical protein [Eubacteriales bacterium]